MCSIFNVFDLLTYPMATLYIITNYCSIKLVLVVNVGYVVTLMMEFVNTKLEENSQMELSQETMYKTV